MSTAKPGTQVLIGIGVVVALALLVTVALSQPNIRSYPDGTPEATAQAYLQAVFDEDHERAHGYLSANLQTRCSPHDIDLWWAADADSATFDEVKIDGGHADIDLLLTSTDYDHEVFPFPEYDHSRHTELELELIDGDWVITDATWPLAGCTWR